VPHRLARRLSRHKARKREDTEAKDAYAYFAWLVVLALTVMRRQTG
jgi:hypothetical protein